MIKLIGGELWQWDTGRQVQVTSDANEVHFGCCIGNDALIVAVVDGVADIPNILLQRSLDIKAWCVVCSDTCAKTIHEVVFDVNARNKPSDYVYTETEVKNYDTLEKLIKELEEKIDNITISEEQISDVVDKALTQAKESGEFDGKDGYTPQKGVDYFTEEDKTEIVNEVVESLDFDSVGGSPLFVVTITGDEENGYSADKTFEEIAEAYESGKIVQCSLYGEITIDISTIADYEIAFKNNGIEGLLVFSQECYIYEDNTVEVIHDTNSIEELMGIKRLTTIDKTIVGAINEINEKSAGGGTEQVQADWNQNDTTAPDYVKNRPFYEEYLVEAVLFDGVVESETDVFIDFVVGQTYTVTLNGVEYNAACYELDGFAVIGSESLWWGDDYNETELPFVMGDNWFYTIFDGENNQLKVVGDCVKIHKIDSKYLPEEETHEARLVSMDSFTSFISLHLNTNGEFEMVYSNETGASMVYDKLRDAIKWANVNYGSFYSFELNQSFFVYLEPPSDYSNNYEYINIQTNYVKTSMDGVEHVNMNYCWYKDDDGNIWGNCKYTEETLFSFK